MAYHAHPTLNHEHPAATSYYYMYSDGGVAYFDNAGIGAPVAVYNTTAVAPTTGTAGAGGTGASGAGTPMSIINPRSFWNVMIKL
jgi:hypothetical protein